MRGVLLIEMLVAIALFGAIGAIAAQALVVSFRGTELATEKAAIAQLLSETVRAARGASDESWDNLYGLTKGAVHYHPELQGGKWAIVPGDETLALGVASYTRYFTVDNVSRDPVTREIEDSYTVAHDDPSTQKLTVVVAASSTGALSTSAYLFRWRNVVCEQGSWLTSGATGVQSCPDTEYANAANITPGETLQLCSGGC